MVPHGPSLYEKKRRSALSEVSHTVYNGFSQLIEWIETSQVHTYLKLQIPIAFGAREKARARYVRWTKICRGTKFERNINGPTRPCFTRDQQDTRPVGPGCEKNSWLPVLFLVSPRAVGIGVHFLREESDGLKGRSPHGIDQVRLQITSNNTQTKQTENYKQLPRRISNTFKSLILCTINNLIHSLNNKHIRS